MFQRTDQVLPRGYHAGMKFNRLSADAFRPPATINVHETDRLDQWCRAFGATRLEICAAVSAVGSNADVVKRHLRLARQAVR